MTTRSKSYHQTLERMQQSIRKFDYQLEQSRMLTHDITIDNKTNQNLDFIIKVQDELNQLEVSRSQSRVSVPQHSTYRHRISTSASRSNEKRQGSLNTNKYLQNSSQHLRTNFQNLEQSSATNKQQQNHQRQYYSLVRLQKKFQPLSRIQEIKEQKLKQQQKSSLIESGVQTELEQPFSNFSQIKQQQRIFQPVIEQHRRTAFLKTPKCNLQMQKQFCQNTIQSTVEKVKQEKNQIINLPVSVSENKLQTLFERISGHNMHLQEDPEAEQQFIGKTVQQECLNISFNKFQTNGKINIESKQNKQWKVVPLTLGYQNNKKYHEVSKQKQLFKINKQKQKQKKIGINTSTCTRVKSKSKASTNKQKGQNIFSKIQINKKQEKPSANDLFLQRKALLVQDLQKNNKKKREIYHIKQETRSPAKTTYISQFTYKNISNQEKKKRQISPKALQVSERLYSRSKGKLKPCDHYLRFSQSIQRQRFDQIIRQNIFVSRKMSSQQKQEVFQCLRKSEDSVSTWPIKILNYTYSKLEKIKVYSSKPKIKTLA